MCATIAKLRDQAPTVQAPETGQIELLRDYPFTVSIIVVSFNTRELLRECLESLIEECHQLPGNASAEILVVDNASSDGSPEMVEQAFYRSAVPVRLLRSQINLGFGSANNLALKRSQGRFLVLVNSDAFLSRGALGIALSRMESSPKTGFGGALLVGRDGTRQPSARLFHSIWRDALILTGLSAKFPGSRIFGAPDRTWADHQTAADVDWVPGAFMIMRREALVKTGLFDPRFFLYYEETDLCRRLKAKGFRVSYWPNITVTHIGGESGRQLTDLTNSKAASRVELWRMRSTLLYYRKHHGWQVHLALWLESGLYKLRSLRNRNSSDPLRRFRAEEAAQLDKLIHRAWRETQGGRVSPPRPW